jgi:hypothetical protein
MALRVGVDVDGVLADFRTAFRAAAAECLRTPLPDANLDDPKTSQALGQDDVRKVWEWIGRAPNWWMGLQPYEPDQIAALYKMARASGWEVFFMTNRPPSGGDTPQFQTQWWIEQYGFYLPAVMTIPGSRGDIANGLRLDLVIDDLLLNCVEVVSSSTTKAVLMLRSGDAIARDHATNRGIGVVATLAEALAVLERLQEVLPRKGRLLRLADWFVQPSASDRLPDNPRRSRPLPGK